MSHALHQAEDWIWRQDAGGRTGGRGQGWQKTGGPQGGALCPFPSHCPVAGDKRLLGEDRWVTVPLGLHLGS